VTDRSVAVRLSLIVALAGLVPIAVVGGIGIELIRTRTQRTAERALDNIAEQVAARTASYLRQQQRLLRAVAAVASPPDAQRRLEESVLDAPSLGRVTLLGPQTPEDQQPKALTAQMRSDALAGKEVASPIFLAEDTTPAKLHCVPARAIAGHAVCAQFDLLELWRFVQRITAGDSGYALVFDENGKLLASGSGRVRAAILTGERIPTADHLHNRQRYVGAEGVEVLAGFAAVPDTKWTVAVEQPASEALGPARTAQWLLSGVLLGALALSVFVGRRQSARVLEVLAKEERWKTAGRIASGITHDLGHRLRTLQVTSNLAADGNPAYLPRIKENLASEVAALQKFVDDFSQLGRDVQKLELEPLEVGAFLESVAKTAAAHGQSAGVSLGVARPGSPLWIRADRYLLERALLNLTSNAIEASSKGAAVDLAATRTGDAVAISVQDRGHGIEPERLEKLFDAFVSTRRTGSHLGLGLANVKRICDAHQASVSVTSSLGQGSTFIISLAGAEAPATVPDQGRPGESRG
jgi:signal transduction histidine kinase